MKQLDNGLWVPDGHSESSRPNWPPRFAIPEDSKHPKDFHLSGADRGMNTNSIWTDKYNPVPKPQAMPPQPRQAAPANVLRKWDTHQ